LLKEAFMPRLNYIDIIDIAYLGGKVWKKHLEKLKENLKKY
jgi:hypothetical protein